MKSPAMWFDPDLFDDEALLNALKSDSDSSSECELSEEEEKAPTTGGLKDVANLTARKHNADETLKRHCEELTKAERTKEQKMHRRSSCQQKVQENHFEIQRAQMLAKQAEAKPLAPPAPKFVVGQKVRIKASFCQASPVFHSSAESEKQWTVEQVDGAVCSLRCYGPNGLEARIMRAEALELCLVNIFTAGAPVLIRNLPMNFWPCLEGHHGIWQQRQGYDSSQVYFPNFARRIVVPNSSIFSAHPQPVPGPESACAEEVEEILGFKKRSYVRDVNGREGVVEGRCPEDPEKLQVNFSRNCNTFDAVQSVLPATLATEKAWQEALAERLQGKVQPLKEAAEAASAEFDASVQHECALMLRSEQLEKAAKKANNDLTKATKKATPISVVTAVRFKPKKEKAVKSWRDINQAVQLEWAVKVEEGSGPDKDGQQSSPPLLTLPDCRGMARSVVQSRAQGHHIISAKRKVNKKLSKGSLSVGRRVAKSILKRVKGDPPQPLASVALLKAALGGLDEVVLDSKVQEFFDSPEMGIIRAKDVPLPKKLEGRLRPYQLTGYHWLVNNARNGLGCILADDMGLGKTLQSISLILYMKQHGMLDKPMLVVVPKGLLTTWSKELKMWAGDELKVHTYFDNKRCVLPHMAAHALAAQTAKAKRGPTATEQKRRLIGKQSSTVFDKEKQKQQRAAKRQEKRLQKVSSADVFLTSYGVFRADVEKLACPDAFSGIILDEAQQIKNYNAQISKAVKQVAELVGPVRIALSGTPVENRLADLHSQFEFILPGYLASSRKEFEQNFGKPIAQAARGVENPDFLRQQRLLQRIVRPFILRRLKTDPEICKDLPEKIEQDHECELSESQQKLYKAAQEAFQQLPSRDDKFARHNHIFSMLQALREICNHPFCLAENRRPQGFGKEDIRNSSTLSASGKCTKLEELLRSILESNEKVLIFSTSLTALEMLSKQITDGFNCKVLKIVGSMGKDQREAVMNSFQTDPASSVLLLSLQAGGVGLTLTAASHVIHFDRQYNPAKENQATDRAHRIGQTKTVMVHRLVSKGTFEEKLGEIMKQKQNLSNLTVEGGEGWIADLDDEQLKELLSLSS